MAGKHILFTILIVLIVQSKSSKLNVPRVLLPIFNDFSSNFTLEVTDGGCYKWTTSRIDLVQLNVDNSQDDDCSSRVVVLTISKEPIRNTAIVLAEDIYTGQVLRCDVILDVIAMLNIVTTTRELFMEEAPEAFEVRAYDDQGNEFTTLEGIEFEWTLSSSGNTVLRFITFKDSPYETPATVQAFEETGKQGHITLLEGVKTGSAKVSVKLPHLEYSEVNACEVSLIVIANLIIEPSDVYILHGDVVHYRIIQVKQGRLEEIKLPSAQYYLVSQNPEIGLIEENSGYLTGMTIGKTKILLYDRNVDEKDTSLRLPAASVSVTTPGRVSMSLLPHRNWAVLVGEQHDLVVEVYASNGHKIHLGDGVQMKTLVDDMHFNLTQRSANGSWLTGRTLEQGIARVHTTLVSVVSTKLGEISLNPKLTAKAEILIFPRIVINPSDVVLPWDPVSRPRYDVELKATGGDNTYLWSTSNHTVGVVTQSGLVRTQWLGQFDTCASMARNHHNRQCVRFRILPPIRMEIIDYVNEAEIGQPIFLNIALFGLRTNPDGSSTQVPFTKCKELPFVITSSDHNFFHNNSAVGGPVGVSCASIAMTGLTATTSHVTVSYKTSDLELEETATISSFRPLRVMYPKRGETVLALGTRRSVVFVGGPRPWVGRPMEHIVKVESTNKVAVDAVDVTEFFKMPGSTDFYVIQVLCKQYGESTVSLSVFNKPLVPNCKYVESIAYVSVVCAKPESIHLQPEIKVEDVRSCPMDLSAERVIVQSYSTIDLVVKVKDSHGRTFDNVTSLNIDWELRPSSLGTVQNANGIVEKTFVEENVMLPNKTTQIIKPESQTGIMEVTATVLGYNPTYVGSAAKAKPLTKREQASTLLTLYLVNDVVVSPNKTSIYNYPLNKQRLTVQQGSGFFELALDNQEVAFVKYIEGLRQIEITPKQPGELHLSVKDLCLKGPPALVVLSIVTVASIRVDMFDRVEIGKCISVIVQFYDEFDNLMPLPKLEYLDVRFTLDDPIVNVRLVSEDIENPLPVGEIHYVITGVELGETKIEFVAGRGERQITSLPMDIQVFAPLRISPRNATLIISAVVQLALQGGPQPDTNIEFIIEADDIADVNQKGVVHAKKIGNTRVIARSVSFNSAGVKVSHSQDMVDVYVIPLLGIQISAPLTRFLEGTIVPAWTTGIPEKISSLVLGSLDPPPIFVWSTSCPDIISLRSMMHPLGVFGNKYNKVCVQMKGIRPGHCTVELKVNITGAAANSKSPLVLFNASLRLEVIEKLLMSEPTGFDGQVVLMAPNSKMQLQTNKDKITMLKYSISDPGSSNKSMSFRQPILKISTNGLVQSFDVIGQSMVIVTGIDEHGLKQKLHVVVQVKPIHYMLMTVQTKWIVPYDSRIKEIPLGAKFQLTATYHDNTGATFQAAHYKVRTRTNRGDLLDVKLGTNNATVLVSIINAGSTVFKFWAEGNMRTAEYMHLLSGQAILPSNVETLTSGDVLCMWSPVTATNGMYGDWIAEPEGIISMNSVSGIGYVKSIRRREVYIKYSLTNAVPVQFVVEPISKIVFVYNNSEVVSNREDAVYRIPIVFKDKKNPKKTSNLFTGYDCREFLESEIIEFPFICDIDFSDPYAQHIETIFQVYPAFNKDLGLYSCNLHVIGEITTNTSVIDSHIEMTVISDNGIESQQFHIEFVPAIFISDTELEVDDVTYSTILAITGLPTVLPQVTVEPLDKSLIQVSKMGHVSSVEDHYEIRLLDYHWKLDELVDPLCVMVSSPMTQQFVKIYVKFTGNKKSFCPAMQMGSPLGNFLYEHRQNLLIITTMLVIFFLTFYAYSHYIQPVINVNVASDHSMMMTSSTSPNTSLNRSIICSPSTCYNRLNVSSGSPPMRYGTGEVIQSPRPLCNSPEMCRNRRFL